MYPRIPQEEEEEATQRGTPIQTNLVENTGMGGPQPQLGWANWAGLKQRMAGETTRLFQMILEQLVSNQSTANLNLYGAVNRSLEGPPGGSRNAG